MDRLNLADTFVTLFALLGPHKVLLPVTRMARDRPLPAVRLVMAYATASAAAVGVACALAAPWVATFFHITTASVGLAAGLLFFVYAIGMVFGVHLGEEDPGEEPGAAADHPVTSGFRELLLPFVVSPLGVAAALEESLTASDWGARGVVAGAYAAVVAVDLAAAVIFIPLLRRAHPTSLEVLSRLLGILLAAVGVDLFLVGLAALGVHIGAGR
ncbi:MAG TPA: MarC family protein [Trebonia sp.]|nr:MarC family protein [Trebonia sp.]